VAILGAALPSSLPRAGGARSTPPRRAAGFSVADGFAFGTPRAVAFLALFAFCALFSPVARAGYFSCGVDTHLPSSPTVDSDDLRLSFWESWGDLKISPKITFKVPVGFSPIANYQSSRILGVGWSFPLLESAIFAINDREYELRFPTGHRMILEKTKTPGHLSSYGWKAVTSGKTTTAQSSCGWTLVFNGGRLQQLKTPDGAKMEFLRNATGKQWITLNSRTILTYREEFERDTARRIAHLTLQDGRHAVLRFATRPAILEVLEKTSGGTPRKTRRTERVETLASVQWDGKKEVTYTFGPDSLDVFNPEKVSDWRNPSGKEIFHWDSRDGFMTKDNQGEYSILRIDGVRCLKKKFPDGDRVSIRGENADKSKEVVKSENSKNIYLVEKFPNSHPFRGKIKKRHRVSESGAKELVESCIYDENGVVTKHLTDGKWISYSPTKDEAKDAKTGVLLWRKKRDASGRTIEFVSGANHYNIEYSGAKASVSILSPDGTVLEKVQLPTAEIQKIFQ
jgi:hypothetical protein